MARRSCREASRASCAPSRHLDLEPPLLVRHSLGWSFVTELVPRQVVGRHRVASADQHLDESGGVDRGHDLVDVWRRRGSLHGAPHRCPASIAEFQTLNRFEVHLNFGGLPRTPNEDKASANFEVQPLRPAPAAAAVVGAGAAPCRHGGPLGREPGGVLVVVEIPVKVAVPALAKRAAADRVPVDGRGVERPVGRVVHPAAPALTRGRVVNIREDLSVGSFALTGFSPGAGWAP